MDEQENEQFCEMIGGELQQILLDGTMNMHNKVVVLNTLLVESRFKEYLESFAEHHKLNKPFEKRRNKHLKKKAKSKQGKIVEQTPHPDPIRWAEYCRPIFQDMRPCYYATVAVVYDWTKNGTLIKTLTGWPNLLSLDMWSLIREFHCGYKPEKLRTALLNVKKDLLDNCQLQEETAIRAMKGTTGIDRIIDLVTQIADALTLFPLSKFSTEERALVNRYEIYIEDGEAIEKLEQELSGASDAKDKAGIKKKIQSLNDRRKQFEKDCDPNSARQQYKKYLESKAKHERDTLPSLQKELRNYLNPRWDELLKHTKEDYPLREKAEYFINTVFGKDKGNVIDKSKELIGELELVKASLEYAQTQTPETQQLNEKPEHTAKEQPPPIPIEGLWKSQSLKDLRDIDSDTKRKGITGDKRELKNLKDYLKRRHKRGDIADTLYIENKRIKTTMRYKSMFSE